MNDIELIILLASAAAGAITNALLGWAETDTPFNTRKFVPSMIRAAISAIVILIGTTYVNIETVNVLIYVLVFLSGMGIDSGGNRLGGTILKTTQVSSK